MVQFKRIHNFKLFCFYQVSVDKFTHDHDIYCDPKADCVLRLGEFIGEKKYEKDYIPKCSCHNNVDT